MPGRTPDPGFWRDRRVFITGHTGFKGGWLTLWLQAMGARVTGFALEPPTRPSLFEAARVAEGMTSLHGDIRDREALERAMLAGEPEILLHLAAQPLVRLSYAQPVETFATNVMGTVHVLEAARRCPALRAILVISSDKCYENRGWPRGYREDDAMGGHDPYSGSKGCTELVAAAYRASFFSAPGPGRAVPALATARAGNVIGGGDWAADRLVPDALRAFSANRALSIRNPHAIRPWQHVLEPLSGYLVLAEQLRHHGPAVAEGWNFGPEAGDEGPVGRVAEMLARLWGDGARWERDGITDHPPEAGLLKLDSAKARDRLGWRPRWPLEQALAATVAWVRAHRAGADMRAVSLDQIAAFAPGTIPVSSFAPPAEASP